MLIDSIGRVEGNSIAFYHGIRADHDDHHLGWCDVGVATVALAYYGKRHADELGKSSELR